MFVTKKKYDELAFRVRQLESQVTCLNHRMEVTGTNLDRLYTVALAVTDTFPEIASQVEFLLDKEP